MQKLKAAAGSPDNLPVLLPEEYCLRSSPFHPGHFPWRRLPSLRRKPPPAPGFPKEVPLPDRRSSLLEAPW
ncbi:hypothetical protein EVA_09000 [gut metagenome]|uniref:Uncharacterized protein n=1 Tax=gut metagenome TaxID=749906 RepID=J9G6M0_9ZZZZ